MNARRPKPKKCAVCKQLFTQFTSLTKVCSVPCSLKYVHGQKAKQWRMEKREYRQANEKLSDLLKKAQKAFNTFIRLRDRDQPCISCGTHTVRQHFRASAWNAGHFRSVGSCPELRFDEDNVHKQCVECNFHRSGNHAEYRERLLKRIGTERLAWIEGPHKPKHYTHEALRELARIYRAKARELRKLMNDH